jgi:hypothetical protein
MSQNVVPIGTNHRTDAAAACAEHTNFTLDRLEEEGLVVIKVSDISFDYSDMSCQPRTESVNHEAVKTYYHQAVNGFEGSHGIRTPILVTENPLKGKELYKGIGGHHRYRAACKAEYVYLICKVVGGFFDMTGEEQMDLMMFDNVHGNNGMKSDRKSLLGALATTLNSKTYLSKERSLIKQYQSYLDSGNLTEDQEKSVLENIKPLVDQVKADLRARIVRWAGGTLSSSNVSTIATLAYTEWNNCENTKVYIHDKKEAATLLVKYMLQHRPESHESKILSKRFGHTIGNNTVDDRQISGEIGKMLKKHSEENSGSDPDEFILAVHLSGASSVRKLLQMRIKFALEISEYVSFIRPTMGGRFKVLFYGQIKTDDLHEDHEKLYSLREIENKLASIENRKRD